ncbi:MAG TPA: DUF4129 domain-containing protein [Pyrinomonadaceae bacterium]|nr:DUF4129 domain-containing protein [Pyrinomonadaceae bacterium]
MVKRKPPLQIERQVIFARRFAMRLFFMVSLALALSAPAYAIPVSEYHKHLTQAFTALDSLGQSDENESANAYALRDVETVRQVRNLLPSTEAVESNGESFKVDNSWLHQELDKYAADNSTARYELLKRIGERVKALDERLEELERPASGTSASKVDERRRLEEILRRPEYAHEVQQENAISRLVKRFVKWVLSWLPKPKPTAPGGVGILSRIAQWVVILLALGVLAFVLKLFLPRVFRNRRPAKKRKEKARIVLGETLAPNQTASDLLSEAEALARRGELRAAIRRAYIALLVELGDRKVISLAQYKTNRDYLRAMREIEPLYRNVKQLTDSFELHWYGLAQANENDWVAFRSGYNQALMR